jgi:hypothetical protein
VLSNTGIDIRELLGKMKDLSDVVQQRESEYQALEDEYQAV